MESLKKRKMKVGVIVSNAMEKTVVVEVTRTVQDPLFQKYVRKKNKFIAHDSKSNCQLGDIVEIKECRPLSRRKRWCVVRTIKKTEMPAAINVD